MIHKFKFYSKNTVGLKMTYVFNDTKLIISNPNQWFFSAQITVYHAKIVPITNYSSLNASIYMKNEYLVNINFTIKSWFKRNLIINASIW